MKLILKLCILLIILTGCEKNNLDINDDCFEETTQYNPFDEVTSWTKTYYRNNNIIKIENSDGDVWKTEYDNFGNRISIVNNGSKIEYEYNSKNMVVKTSVFSNSFLDFYTVNEYSDTLITRTLTYFEHNDTSWSRYYYNENGKIDSLISSNWKSYYYFSPGIDSTITLSNENKIISIRIKKITNGKNTYEELRHYDINEQLYGSYIITYEYNEFGLISRQTKSQPFATTGNQWFDERKFYNDMNQISRIESYDQTNKIISYSEYYYLDPHMTKLKRFDSNDSLTSYVLIENNCNK